MLQSAGGVLFTFFLFQKSKPDVCFLQSTIKIYDKSQFISKFKQIRIDNALFIPWEDSFSEIKNQFFFFATH